jgi:hypothetical protein
MHSLGLKTPHYVFLKPNAQFSRRGRLQHLNLAGNQDGGPGRL